MENYTSYADHNTSSFVRCPQLADFAQWKSQYLSPAVFYNSIAAVTVNGLMMLVITISNALVMFCILVNKKYRRQSFKIILCSLSTTDFLVGLFVQPLFIMCRISELRGHLNLVCRVRQVQTVAGVSLLGISLLHSCFISIERYLAVRFPFRYKTVMKNGRVIVILLLIWLAITTYSVLPFIGYPEAGSLIGRSAIVLVVVVVTAACYIGTFSQLGAGASRREKNLVSSLVKPNASDKDHSCYTDLAKLDQPRCSFSSANPPTPCETAASGDSSTCVHRLDLPHQPSTSRENPDQISKSLSKVERAASVPKLSPALQKRQKDKRLARTMLIVVGILALCYLPEMITYPFLPKNEEEKATNWIVLSWTNTLLYLNSFINPFLYCSRMPDLKKSILQIVKRKDKVAEMKEEKHTVSTQNQNVKDNGLSPNNAEMPCCEQAKELNQNKPNRLSVESPAIRLNAKVFPTE